MKTIGFTNKFYTLWSVSVPYKEYINKYDFYMKQDCGYIQNLSTDLEKAKAKIEGDYNIDLELRGSSSFTRDWNNNNSLGTDLKEYQYPTGIRSVFSGRDIREFNNNEDDIKALWVMYLKNNIWNNSIEAHSFKNLNPNWVKPCVYARRRLIELDLLVRYTFNDKDGNIYRYTTPDYKEKLENRKSIDSLKSGHHFSDGEKVELLIKLVDVFGFDGAYGYTSIHTYESSDGRKFKYMGSSPANISWDEFIKIKATIKHDNYNGVKETKLQRIKLI